MRISIHIFKQIIDLELADRRSGIRILDVLYNYYHINQDISTMINITPNNGDQHIYG